MGKLVIDGNSVYELDEACMQKKGEAEKQRNRRRVGTTKRTEDIKYFGANL